MDNYIFWVLTAAYAAHVMEEYALDWKGWVKDMAGADIPWGEFFVTNAAVIVLGICCAMTGWARPAISLVYPALMLVNALFFHVLPTIIKRVYSPGVLTSVLLFIPLSGFSFYLAVSLYNVTALGVLVSFLGGIIIMAYPPALQKLKRTLKKR